MSITIPALLKPSTYLDDWRELIKLSIDRRQLIGMLAKREVTEQYTGQIFGIWWVVVHPLTIAAIFIFIFGVIFKAKVGGTRELPLDYSAYIMAGLIPWIAFQEVMGKATGLIAANATLVKQIMFRMEILPIKTSLASLATQLVGTAALIIYVLITHGGLHPTYALLPILFLLQLLVMLAVGFLFSAIGIYFRDLKDFVRLVSTIGIYITPAVFLPQWIPAKLQFILYFNPYTFVIWCYQDALYFGEIRHPWAWVITVLMGTVGLAVTYRTFQAMKHGFGDLI